MDKASTDLLGQIECDQIEEDEGIALANLEDQVDQKATGTEYLCLIKDLHSYNPAADPTHYPREPIPLIKRLWEAFMNVEDITDKKLASGKQCQAATRITTGYYPSHAIETACWDVLINCYNSELQGRLVLPHHCLKPDDSFATVEDRLDAVIYTLRVNKAVCKMLLDPVFIHRLIDNPYKELKAKENNNRINGIRDQQNHIGRAAIKRGVDDKEKIQGILTGVLGPEIVEPKSEKAQVKAAKPKKPTGIPRGKKAAGVNKKTPVKRKRAARNKMVDEDDEEEEEDEAYADFDPHFYDFDKPVRPKRSRSDAAQKSYIEVESDFNSPYGDFKSLPKTPRKRGSTTGYRNAHYSSPMQTNGTPGSVYDLLSSVEPASSSDSRLYPAQPTPEGFAGSESNIFSSPADELFAPIEDFASSVSRRLFAAQLSSTDNSFGDPFSGMPTSSPNEYPNFGNQEPSPEQGSLSNLEPELVAQVLSLRDAISETGVTSPSVQPSTPSSNSAAASSLSNENLALLAMFQKGSQEDARNAHNNSSPDELKTTWEFCGLPNDLPDHHLEYQYRSQICAILGVPLDLIADTTLENLRTYAHAYNKQFNGISWTPAFCPYNLATGPIVNTDEGLVHLGVAEQTYVKLALARGDIDKDGNMVENPAARMFLINQSDIFSKEALGMIPNRFGIHYAVHEAVKEMQLHWLGEGMEERMKERHGEQLGAQLAAEMRFWLLSIVRLPTDD